MKKTIISLFLLLLSASSGWYGINFLQNKLSIIAIFISGLLFGLFLMSIHLNVKNSTINTYKRELEKESISSSENDAKVKVLEEKIKVLEKTLEKFLKK